jgi:hypothetical protein
MGDLSSLTGWRQPRSRFAKTADIACVPQHDNHRTVRAQAWPPQPFGVELGQPQTAGAVNEVDPAAQRWLMGNRRMDAKAFGLMAALLVLTGAVLLWIRRRTWTDHNVSDPGVTL